jgi:hypothetical protein
VVLTSIVKVAVWLLPPVTVKAQCPTALGVTANVCELLPEVGETLAIPLQVGDPFVTVKDPLKLVSLAVKV